LDLSRPVAVMLVAVLQFVGDDDEAYAAVRTLMDAVPAGSFWSCPTPPPTCSRRTPSSS
jgi:hypothetical protein